MSYELEAVYENGTLKLDHVLPFAEHQRVKVTVEQRPVPSERAAKQGDWWETLQDIVTEQGKEGFVGTVTEIDRGDDAYEQRMREIHSNTTDGNAGS